MPHYSKCMRLVISLIENTYFPSVYSNSRTQTLFDIHLRLPQVFAGRGLGLCFLWCTVETWNSNFLILLSSLFPLRNIVYNLSLSDFTEQRRLVWHSPENDVKMCVMKGKDDVSITIYWFPEIPNKFPCSRHSFVMICFRLLLPGQQPKQIQFEPFQRRHI